MKFSFSKAIVFFSAILFTRNVFSQEAAQSVYSKNVINVDVSRLPVIKSMEKIDVEREITINGQKVIRTAKDDDPLLKQYDEEISFNNQLIRQLKTPNVNFYVYTAKKTDSLVKLAARFCVTADSFVVISGIPSQDDDIAGKTLIVPTAKGLFIPSPEDNSTNLTPLETLLQKNRAGALYDPENMWFNINGREYVFIPDDMFTPTERAFFLDSGMVVPVKEFRISSDYGTRKDPLGSGARQFHKGIDMAVPEGTDVMACKSGVVSDCGENAVYGKWILIEHQGGVSSFYAHLSSIGSRIQKGAQVKASEVIAKSGSTGQVTGPHLHFEVRKAGGTIDPKKSLKL